MKHLWHATRSNAGVGFSVSVKIHQNTTIDANLDGEMTSYSS